MSGRIGWFAPQSSRSPDPENRIVRPSARPLKRSLLSLGPPWKQVRLPISSEAAGVHFQRSNHWLSRLSGKPPLNKQGAVRIPLGANCRYSNDSYRSQRVLFVFEPQVVAPAERIYLSFKRIACAAANNGCLRSLTTLFDRRPWISFKEEHRGSLRKFIEPHILEIAPRK